MKIKLIFDDGTETEISERGLKELAKALKEGIQDKKITLDPWGGYVYSGTNEKPIFLGLPPSQC